jgi:putative ABC transport system permease protein
MFRNCLAAALRHLARNRLYTVISIVGLSVGLWGALLTALIIHDQLSHDHFIPGYDRIYIVTSAITPPGHATIYYDRTLSFVGPQLAVKFSEIQALTRLDPDNATVSHANVESHEPVYWADPNAFEVLPLPVVAGDLSTALARPDSVVLSRNMARKYFGRDAPLGETLALKVDGSAESHELSVAAVIEDPPPNGTHLAAGIFVSSLAPWTALHVQEAIPLSVARTQLGVGPQTYVKLAPHVSAQRLLQAMPTMAPALFTSPPEGWSVSLNLVRLDRMDADPGLNPGFASKLVMLTIVGFGIVFIAGINFVNLLTARSVRRAREVSVRKLAGAQRHVLMLQFLAESILYVVMASLVAVALTELLLPYANAFLVAGATFRYWQDPALIGAIVLVALFLGTLAGAYPAVVLSAFNPLRVLTGQIWQSRSAALMRQVLVTLQFAILIGLIIAAAVVYQQRVFATRDALRINSDQMLLIRSACNTAFSSALQEVPGVRGVGCSSSTLVDHGTVNVILVKDKVGAQQLLYPIQVQPSVLVLYGIKPLAGRIPGGAADTYYLLNQTAARQLGFARPVDAIGYKLPTHGGMALHSAPVVGVVPDFSLGSVADRIEAQGFLVSARDPMFNLISVKLTGQQIPATLGAIDQLWKSTGAHDPISRIFLDERIQTMYLAMLREAQLFGVFALVAIVLACLGLLALAASIAERRTREIGIRKALGADTSNVIHLLLRQFTMPVLWANLFAWPVTALAMHHWLQGFAYHVDLAVWLFPAAAALALLIALLTVTTHSILVARAPPVAALRYE